jgi:hypothetical protein
MLLVVKVQEGHLHFGGQVPVIHLHHQGGHIGIQVGMVLAREEGGIADLQAIEGVDTQRHRHRLQEANPRHDAQGQSCLARQCADLERRRLTHQRMAGHRKDDPLGSLAQFQHPARDLLVDLLKSIEMLVLLIE